MNILMREDSDGRWIEGIAVPWKQRVKTSSDYEYEEFAPGGLVPRSEPIPLRYGHQRDLAPVGRVVDTVDSDEGLWISALMLDTERGAEAWAAARAGLVTGFSVEFSRRGPTFGRGPRALQGHVDDGVLNGVALTESPMYSGARVTQVRARTPRLDEWSAWIEGLRS